MWQLFENGATVGQRASVDGVILRGSGEAGEPTRVRMLGSLRPGEAETLVRLLARSRR